MGGGFWIKWGDLPGKCGKRGGECLELQRGQVFLKKNREKKRIIEKFTYAKKRRNVNTGTINTKLIDIRTYRNGESIESIETVYRGLKRA